MGQPVPRDHPGLAKQLGVRDPVPGVPRRGAPRDLHHECNRGTQPPAAQRDQNQRTLPQRGGRPKTHLPRHRQRRPSVDPNPELDDSAARVQDPLRTPSTRLTAYTETRTPSGLRLRTAVNSESVLSERRRRFPQVLPDDEGGLRRETHRNAIGGDTSRDRQASGEGMVNDPQKMLSELGRLGARLIIQRAVEDEFDQWLGRARYERRPERQRGLRNYDSGLRNGFRPRHVQTAEGELRIEIRQARESVLPFVSKLFPKWHCKRP